YQENKNSAQTSLFGEGSGEEIPEPMIPPCEEWATMMKLKKEREVVGIYISGHPLDDFKKEIDHFCTGRLADFNNMENNVGREISFAGVITDVQHLVSKNGKGWGIFTVEDYTDSYDFKIFGEDYLKYRHFLLPNNFIYIKAGIEEGWVNRKTGQAGEPRIKFRLFKQLQDVLDEFAKKLTIRLDVNEIKEDSIQTLTDIFRTYQGDHQLHFVIYELSDRLKVHMPSRKKNIKICTDLLTELEKNQIYYKLN